MVYPILVRCNFIFFAISESGNKLGKRSTAFSPHLCEMWFFTRCRHHKILAVVTASLCSHAAIPVGLLAVELVLDPEELQIVGTVSREPGVFSEGIPVAKTQQSTQEW